jgi:hypothetical protein
MITRVQETGCMREHLKSTTSVPPPPRITLPAFNLEALIDMASNTSTRKDKDGNDTNMEVDYVISYCFAATGKF